MNYIFKPIYISEHKLFFYIYLIIMILIIITTIYLVVKEIKK